MINRVYIANRGEIAARVARTCARLGVDTVVADVDSYLDIDALITQATGWGADSVHPGYGFLSENADFARAVEAAGMVWIGPPPEAIEAMARKDRAREIAEEAGVPVAPRYEVDDVPADAYPVLVKAAAGGGGKGMHVVEAADDLAEAVATARREAMAAFGDDTLLLERYIRGGRHVEVQVFGDRDGNVVHLGTRDCSAQRRHQKVVEEAPAPNLSDGLRERLHAASVALARAVGYTNAGTVEFLVLDDEAFLLEMNTRLQVEHPVTEEVTGLDLVEWQVRIASGEPLPLRQDEVTFAGHAVEARVYAEDPYAGFLPQAGRAVHWDWPAVRVETDFAGEVSTAFDPMIAKIVVHGPDRAAAITALIGALDATVIAGLTTNVGFVRRLVASAEFAAVQVATDWLDSPAAAWLLERPAPPPAIRAAGAVATDDPFGRADGWRLGADPVPPWPGHVVRDDERTWASLKGETWEITEPDPFDRDHRLGPATDDVVAPMPGTVLAIDVAEGDVVAVGQRLGTLEAMKMELALLAPHDGTVTHLGASAGDQVTLGHVVATVVPAPES